MIITMKLFKYLLQIPEWVRSQQGGNEQSEQKENSPLPTAVPMSTELKQRLERYRESRQKEYGRALTALGSGGLEGLHKFWEDGGGEESARLARELREFCLTTGQDLGAADRFIQNLDAEFTFEFT
jgi:hypothetical protein